MVRHVLEVANKQLSPKDRRTPPGTPVHPQTALTRGCYQLSDPTAHSKSALVGCVGFLQTCTHTSPLLHLFIKDIGS